MLSRFAIIKLKKLRQANPYDSSHRPGSQLELIEDALQVRERLNRTGSAQDETINWLGLDKDLKQ